MSNDSPQNATNAPQNANAPQGQQMAIDESKTVSSYANFCRVTGTPEELIIDFGLNPQQAGPMQTPIEVNQRVVMNFYTAKRVLLALSATIKRHEDNFGELELDIQKRVVKKAEG